MSDDLKERLRRLIVLHITSSGYTVDELADAAIALVRAETLEEAAKVADEVEKRDRQASKEPCDMEEQAAFMRGAFVSRNIAAAIRALKERT